MTRCLYSLARSLACLGHWNIRRLRTPSSSPIPLTFAGQPWPRVCGHILPKTFAPSKKPPLFRQKGTQSYLETYTQTRVDETELNEPEVASVYTISLPV